MTPYVEDAWAWQESWDRQQEGYLPDREERFTAMLNAVEAVAGPAPRILDLAGGTGSISLRALRRFPGARTTLVDVDPILLTIARSSLGDSSLAGRAVVVAANLRTPEWMTALPDRTFDAVLTATALHWLSLDRLSALYGEIAGLLRSGGVFINADHMPDDGLPGLSEKLSAWADGRRLSLTTTGAIPGWEGWWELITKDPTLGPLIEERRGIFSGGHTESNPPVSWHLHALRDAGFAEAGLVWRGGTDAAVAGVR